MTLQRSWSLDRVLGDILSDNEKRLIASNNKLRAILYTLLREVEYKDAVTEVLLFMDEVTCDNCLGARIVLAPRLGEDATVLCEECKGTGINPGVLS